MRLVLDTNILVSASISRRGAPARLLDAVRQERVILVTSPQQIDELTAVLSRKKFDRILTKRVRSELFETIGQLSVVVTDLPEITDSPDPDDNLILATAIAGEAELIVSGDKKHVLSLGSVRGVLIVTAAEAVTLLDKGEENDE